MDAATPNPIDATVDEMIETFDLLGDWEQRFRHLIDLGRHLEPLSVQERDDAHKVRGCASQVWLVAEPDGYELLRFRGDSDAHLVRGLIAVLLQLYSGRRPADITAFDARAAFERLGLPGALTRQRSNGLFSMVERIRAEASRVTEGTCN
jgi:cysteine desulfuration protein SufE